MRLEEYKRILLDLSDPESGNAGSEGGGYGVGGKLRAVCLRHAVKYDTIRAIYSNCVKYKWKDTVSRHRANKFYYYQRYKDMVQERAQDAMATLAETVDIPFAELARLVLQCFCDEVLPDASRDDMVKAWLRDPASITCPDKDGNKSGLPLAVLRSDVQTCVEVDDACGPLADRIRANIGKEYEYILYEYLLARNVRFINEETQRTASFKKTPDVMLTTPIEVQGSLVYWIDSKACFGDDLTMKESYERQFFTYLRHIGPGLVIYWFGFLEDVPPLFHAASTSTLIEEWRREGLLVLDHFPDHIVPRPDLPPPEPVNVEDI